VIRGGSWDDGPSRLGVSLRNWLAPYDVSSSVGFRCVYPR
jgi:formylglycine-generating enzyme required for sulfatase activity